MSNWYPVGDGIFEYQQETGAKPDGTYTISVREIGQTTKYPHVNLDYDPDTGVIRYNHTSYTGSKRAGTRENVQAAISYLKGLGLL